MSKVVVLRTSPKNVLLDYRRLMDLVGFKKVLNKSYNTILKLNLSWNLFFPACSTPPWQIDGVITPLIEAGYRVRAVENKTVVTNPWKGAYANRWLNLLESKNVKFTPLTEVEWVNYKPKSELSVLDSKVFPEGIQIPKMFLNTNIVQLPTMKTHGHSVITGAMKNAFGGLLKEARHHCHTYIHDVLVDLLKIQKEIHRGMLAVMDGTVCGNGAGPRTMTPEIKNFILASDDMVAIDAIAAQMMGFNPMKIDFIRKAHEEGLGIGDVNQIEVIGDDISNVNFNFKTEKSPVIFFDQLFRKGMLSFLEPLIFRTWLFNLCVLASAWYHDEVWYPSKGGKIVQDFYNTEWGKLFLTY